MVQYNPTLDDLILAFAYMQAGEVEKATACFESAMEQETLHEDIEALEQQQDEAVEAMTRENRRKKDRAKQLSNEDVSDEMEDDIEDVADEDEDEDEDSADEIEAEDDMKVHASKRRKRRLSIAQVVANVAQLDEAEG